VSELRICLFGGTFLPHIGGSELSLHHLAKGFQQRGHRPVVLVPSIKGDLSAWHIDYPVHHYPLARPLFLLIEKLRSRFDILYVNGIYPGGYYAAKLKKLLAVPLVISCPGGDIQTIPELGVGKRLNPKVDQRVHWTVHEADALFAIVPSIRKELESLGVPQERLFDVPHGSDVDRFKDIQSIRSLFPVPEDHKIVILLGRNHVKKGYPDFIRAMPEIARRYPKVSAIIVGRATNGLRPLVEELAVQNHVILSPPFAWDEYPRLLVGSDIYISPSLGEGFSLALADAMAAGVPQVVCDVEGCRDVVRNNETGIVVPKSDPVAMADAVVRLLEDGDLRRRMSQTSQRIAQGFSWDVIIDRHLEIYRQLISSYQGPK
jgi:glycogen(starch) synthase